jgi:hypothetical protein
MFLLWICNFLCVKISQLWGRANDNYMCAYTGVLLHTRMKFALLVLFWLTNSNIYASLEFVVAGWTNLITDMNIVCDGFWMEEDSCGAARGQFELSGAGVWQTAWEGVGVRRGTNVGCDAHSWFQHDGCSRYRLIQVVWFSVSAEMKRQAGRNGRAAQTSPSAFCPFQKYLFKCKLTVIWDGHPNIKHLRRNNILLLTLSLPAI